MARKRRQLTETVASEADLVCARMSWGRLRKILLTQARSPSHAMMIDHLVTCTRDASGSLKPRRLAKELEALIAIAAWSEAIPREGSGMT